MTNCEGTARFGFAPNFVRFAGLQLSLTMTHENHHPVFTRGFGNLQIPETPTEPRTPTLQTPVPRPLAMHVKRITLTSKKNWWMGAPRDISRTQVIDF